MKCRNIKEKSLWNSCSSFSLPRNTSIKMVCNQVNLGGIRNPDPRITSQAFNAIAESHPMCYMLVWGNGSPSTQDLHLYCGITCELGVHFIKLFRRIFPKHLYRNYPPKLLCKMYPRFASWCQICSIQVECPYNVSPTCAWRDSSRMLAWIGNMPSCWYQNQQATVLALGSSCRSQCIWKQ